MAVLFICFHVVIGLSQGETVTTSVPVIGGGSLAGLITVAVIFFVALIPISFRAVGRELGPGRLKRDAVRNRHQVRGSWVSNSRGGWSCVTRPLMCSVSGSGA